MRRKNTGSNQHGIDPEELNEENGVQTTTETGHDRLLRSLQPGDHIAAEKRNGLYEHHGIVVRRDQGIIHVAHLKGPKLPFSKRCASPRCVSNCKHPPKKGGYVVSCLHCFRQGNRIVKMQYMIREECVSDKDPKWNCLENGNVIPGYRNKKFYLEHYLEGNLYGHSIVPVETVSQYTVDDLVKFYEMFSNRSSKEIVNAATERSNDKKPYNLLYNNCEHYSVFCKTGVLRSIQVEKFPVPIPNICKNRKLVSYDGKERQNLNQEEQGSPNLIKKREKKKKTKSWLRGFQKC